MRATRNTILIILAVLMAAGVLFVRYMFNQKVKAFSRDIAVFQKVEETKYLSIRDSLMETLRHKPPALKICFSESINGDKCKTNHDTTVSFLYLSKNISFIYNDSEILLCKYKKCSLDQANIEEENNYLRMYADLRSAYEKEFNEWYPKLKMKSLFEKINDLSNCETSEGELFTIRGMPNAWKEFSGFLDQYKTEREMAIRSEQKARAELNHEVTVAMAKLNTQLREELIDEIESAKDRLIRSSHENKRYSGSHLGAIEYQSSYTSIDKENLNSILEPLYEKNWRYNSLSTGAMPYAVCFGNSNFCDDWNCSKIKVIAGGTGDVLVSIKNSAGNVVRHAYIRGGNSFTFNVPDGKYQVFFYSGTGWNPEKVVPSGCDALKGGFVFNEEVSKDNYISLYNQIMTYELILQSNGNFSTKPSSKGEAF